MNNSAPNIGNDNDRPQYELRDTRGRGIWMPIPGLMALKQDYSRV